MNYNFIVCTFNEITKLNIHKTHKAMNNQIKLN